MSLEARPREVRKLVLAAFHGLGARLGGLFDLQETILIHEGRYTARSYRADGLMAMWFVQLGFVEVYDADGNVLRTVNLSEKLKPLKLAA